MTTPKHLGTQIWQIYPRSAGRCIPHQSSIDATNTVAPNLADLTPHQSSIDALNTITSNLADVLAELPPSIEHKCLEYHYMKLGRSTPHQSSIDALNTVTPNLAHLLTELPPQNCNASWDICYGMYLAAILDSSRKGGNFFLFLNN